MCPLVLTFLREESHGSAGPGKAFVAVKVEPAEDMWAAEDWDSDGNWVGEPAVPVPESGEEDWYEKDQLDEFLPEGGLAVAAKGDGSEDPNVPVDSWGEGNGAGSWNEDMAHGKDSWPTEGEAWC